MLPCPPPAASMSPQNKANASSRACLSCRNKHLKCDGQTPVCARCADADISCVFVKSRRGYRGSAKKPSLDASTVPEIFNSSTFNVPQDLSSATELQFPVQQDPTSLSNETISMPGVESDDVDDEYLVDMYYQNVHPAHPFILPRRVYLQDRTVFPTHLRNTICFIASHHSSHCSDAYQGRSNLVFDPSIPEDGFKVQALILLTLTSYARFERDVGNRALTAAIDLALRIGLNSNSFAYNQNPVFQESWRRTWWELYTITGLISLIGGTNLRLSQPDHMILPAHCEDYETCQTFRIKTTEEMQQRFSTESNERWSSFAYRVEAMRILSNVLDIAPDTAGPRCDAANASISSFLLSLPPDKSDGLKNDGETDEVMSCALMIIHLASICLHLPRSNLAAVRGFKTVCGNERGHIGAEETKAHHAAALRSAKALSNLISSRSSLKSLSPCFSCAIAFAAVVQLSECLVRKSPESNYLKEHVQLELSALKVLGKIWPIARVVRGQIAQFSREVLSKSSRDMFSESIPPVISDEQWLQDLMPDGLEIPSEGFVIPGV